MSESRKARRTRKQNSADPHTVGSEFWQRSLNVSSDILFIRYVRINLRITSAKIEERFETAPTSELPRPTPPRKIHPLLSQSDKGFVAPQNFNKRDTIRNAESERGAPAARKWGDAVACMTLHIKRERIGGHRARLPCLFSC